MDLAVYAESSSSSSAYTMLMLHAFFFIFLADFLINIYYLTQVEIEILTTLIEKWSSFEF